MIIYYDQVSGNITRMAYMQVPGVDDNFFETDDPIAEDIFLRRKKSMQYQIAVEPGAFGKPKIVPRVSKVLEANRSRLVKVLKNYNSPAELHICQDIAEKKITVTLLKESLSWWIGKRVESKIYLTACKDSDPYKPLWSHVVNHADIDNQLSYSIDYTGSDDITFFTTGLFNTYNHEVKSS
jgi:hypothetical protein